MNVREMGTNQLLDFMLKDLKRKDKTIKDLNKKVSTLTNEITTLKQELDTYKEFPTMADEIDNYVEWLNSEDGDALVKAYQEEEESKSEIKQEEMRKIKDARLEILTEVVGISNALRLKGDLKDKVCECVAEVIDQAVLIEKRRSKLEIK